MLAIEDEFYALIANKTRSPGRTAIGCKWVF